MKMNQLLGRIIIFFLMYLTQGCQTWQKEIKSNLKIAHVYSRPSSAYGPGTVVAFTDDSDYTRGCWAWNVMGVERNKYNEEMSKETLNPNSSKLLQKSQITSLSLGVKKEAEIFFNIKLDDNEKSNIESKYQNISEMRVSLKNGSQWDAIPSISDMVKNIQNQKEVCYKDLKLLSTESDKFYLVLTAYSYDLEYQIKIDNKWQLTGNIPEEVLKVIASKISINIKNDSNLTLSGKQLFIGFNGLPQKSTGKVGHAIIGPRIEGMEVIDISDLWNK